MHFEWTPHYCKRLYLDDMDAFGLFTWLFHIENQKPKQK